ncbi:MAG: PH domain-containing protein [bacterium]|nr:PH domain-containing protein [bacterium]
MFANLRGNATEIDSQKLSKSLENVLAEGEFVERAFKLFRDMFVFTNKRLILIDKQGLTGVKVEYASIPYKSIIRFTVETAGNFDSDSEMKIWISGSAAPIEKEFKKGTDIVGVQRTLATYILK